MMNALRRLSMSVVLLCVTAQHGFGQTKPPADFQVALRITSPDSLLRDQINSLVSREMRSLGDVSVVDAASAEYVVSIVAVKTRTQDGQENGIAISTVMVERLPVDMLTNATGNYSLRYWLEDGAYIKQQLVNTGAKDDVKGVCSAVVATLNSDVLEPIRRLFPVKAK